MGIFEFIFRILELWKSRVKLNIGLKQKDFRSEKIGNYDGFIEQTLI